MSVKTLAEASDDLDAWLRGERQCKANKERIDTYVRSSAF